MEKIKDIDNPKEEFEKLSKRFKTLHDRFLAIAMDYTHYIDSTISENEIFKLRDNVLSRLYSARFHFQLLIEYHYRVENRLKELYNKNPKELFQGGFELMSIQEQSTKEIYSLFDSMLYHLCSIYDYLFRLINFAHGKTILDNPKWNLFKSNKNLKNFIYCSEEIIPKLELLDSNFIYPLIKHRSHLIHTESDMGEFKLTFNLGGDNFNAKFQATKLFKANFPEIVKENSEAELTIKYASIWLIDKTIQTTTEILFELRDDMKRNQKIPHGMFVLLGPNNTIQPASTPYWGDRNLT
ncbi:MAG: hypothetical protein LCH32_07710 [Bacteroidetes bacterium]|nr:hypothetical protein [Bacteroidota bacterium]